MISARQAVHASEERGLHASALVKRFRVPDQLLAFDDGRLDVITIGDEVVAKGSFAPGWRWSRCATAPFSRGGSSGTHAGLVLSGRAGLRTEEGNEVELADGDLFHTSFAAPFDLWTIGNRPCEILYVGGVDALIRRLRGRV